MRRTDGSAQGVSPGMVKPDPSITQRYIRKYIQCHTLPSEYTASLTWKIYVFLPLKSAALLSELGAPSNQSDSVLRICASSLRRSGVIFG